MSGTKVIELIDRLAAMRALMSALAGARSVGAVMAMADRHIPHVFSTDRASMGLYDPATDTIQIVPLLGERAAVASDSTPTKRYPIPRSESLLGRVIDFNRPDYVTDLRLDDRPNSKNLLARGYRSTLAVPLRDGEDCIGSLNLASIELNGFNDADRDVLVLAADALSFAMHTASLIEQLSEVAAKAEAASQAKSRFLATISHELRTPLNGVLGMTQMLTATNLDDEQAEYVQIVESSGRGLLDLVDQVLGYTNLENSGADAESHVFRPRQLVERVVHKAAEHVSGKALEVSWRADPSVPELAIGEATRIHQMLNIVLGNAVKFTEHGEATVHIAATPTAPSPTSTTQTSAARTSSDDDQSDSGDTTPITRLWTLVFSVTDTGIGIEAKDLNALFERFGQLDDSTTRRFGGLGLGLATCKQLADLIGATINIESEPGRGTTVTISVIVEKVDSSAVQTLD